jgi:hypothetical protein
LVGSALALLRVLPYVVSSVELPKMKWREADHRVAFASS